MLKIIKQAWKTPNRAAIVANNQSYTYQELLSASSNSTTLLLLMTLTLLMTLVDSHVAFLTPATTKTNRHCSQRQDSTCQRIIRRTTSTATPTTTNTTTTKNSSSSSSTTMTRPAPDLTRHQLGAAASRTNPGGHGLAVLTCTDDGEVLAVCELLASADSRIADSVRDDSTPTG